MAAAAWAAAGAPCQTAKPRRAGAEAASGRAPSGLGRGSILIDLLPKAATVLLRDHGGVDHALEHVEAVMREDEDLLSRHLVQHRRKELPEPLEVRRRVDEEDVAASLRIVLLCDVGASPEKVELESQRRSRAHEVAHADREALKVEDRYHLAIALIRRVQHLQIRLGADLRAPRVGGGDDPPRDLEQEHVVLHEDVHIHTGALQPIDVHGAAPFVVHQGSVSRDASKVVRVVVLYQVKERLRRHEQLLYPVLLAPLPGLFPPFRGTLHVAEASLHVVLRDRLFRRLSFGGLFLAPGIAAVAELASRRRWRQRMLLPVRRPRSEVWASIAVARVTARSHTRHLLRQSLLGALGRLSLPCGPSVRRALLAAQLRLRQTPAQKLRVRTAALLADAEASWGPGWLEALWRGRRQAGAERRQPHVKYGTGAHGVGSWKANDAPRPRSWAPRQSLRAGSGCHAQYSGVRFAGSRSLRLDQRRRKGRGNAIELNRLLPALQVEPGI
eukprot:scaffold873_cov252-Pinguiococcus_pyrenoidosus.AAC.14